MTNPIVAHGPAGLFDYFPVLFIVGAVFVIRAALKDAPRKDSSTRALPTSHLSRQVHSALHQQRRASRPSAMSGFRDALAQGPHDGDDEGRASQNEPRSGE